MNPIQSTGTSSIRPNTNVSPTKATEKPQEAQAIRPSDRIELSGVSHLLAAAQKGDIRADKVADIKAQLEAGTYETGEKIDTTIDRLLEDLD